ncbi:hypothetical protein HJG60_007731 [Phyllostomus discolor]|uniref:Uncharacterized protein n=1 Tax=Phyllostomus discolor TaxID=89673 RepID=A0A834BKE9_9CHIR|nr:hypothetical protein HJG60_007731 [Phyllostomus discolor]
MSFGAATGTKRTTCCMQASEVCSDHTACETQGSSSDSVEGERQLEGCTMSQHRPGDMAAPASKPLGRLQPGPQPAQQGRTGPLDAQPRTTGSRLEVFISEGLDIWEPEQLINRILTSTSLQRSTHFCLPKGFVACNE